MFVAPLSHSSGRANESSNVSPAPAAATPTATPTTPPPPLTCPTPELPAHQQPPQSGSRPPDLGQHRAPSGVQPAPQPPPHYGIDRAGRYGLIDRDPLSSQPTQQSNTVPSQFHNRTQHHQQITQGRLHSTAPSAATSEPRQAGQKRQADDSDNTHEGGQPGDRWTHNVGLGARDDLGTGEHSSQAEEAEGAEGRPPSKRRAVQTQRFGSLPAAVKPAAGSNAWWAPEAVAALLPSAITTINSNRTPASHTLAFGSSSNSSTPVRPALQLQQANATATCDPNAGAMVLSGTPASGGAAMSVLPGMGGMAMTLRDVAQGDTSVTPEMQAQLRSRVWQRDENRASNFVRASQQQAGKRFTLGSPHGGVKKWWVLSHPPAKTSMLACHTLCMVSPLVQQIGCG